MKILTMTDGQIECPVLGKIGKGTEYSIGLCSKCKQNMFGQSICTKGEPKEETTKKLVMLSNGHSYYEDVNVQVDTTVTKIYCMQ